MQGPESRRSSRNIAGSADQMTWALIMNNQQQQPRGRRTGANENREQHQVEGYHLSPTTTVDDIHPPNHRRHLNHDPRLPIESASLSSSSSSPSSPAASLTPYTSQGDDDAVVSCPFDLVTVLKVPGFIIAGAQKAGTSALSNILQHHPKLSRSTFVEPHFFDVRGGWQQQQQPKRHHQRDEDGKGFDNDKKEQQSTNSLDSLEVCEKRRLYAEYFNATVLLESAQQGRGIMAYEKTPVYLVIPDVPALIKTVVPWAKIVVILRDPIERAWSQHKMNWARFGRHIRFAQLINFEVRKLRQQGISRAPLFQNFSVDQVDTYDFAIYPTSERVLGRNHGQKYRGIDGKLLARGLYAEQLKHWLKQYELNRSIKVVQYERFKQNQSAVLDEICDFVNVPRYVFSSEMLEEDHRPVDQYDGLDEVYMSNRMRQYLQRFYQPYNDRLGELLGGGEWANPWPYQYN